MRPSLGLANSTLVGPAAGGRPILPDRVCTRKAGLKIVDLPSAPFVVSVVSRDFSHSRGAIVCSASRHEEAAAVSSAIRKCLDKGQISRAIEKANEAIAEFPNNAYVIMHAAMAMAKGGRVAEARALHQQSVALLPLSPKYTHAWALFEGKVNNVKRARELFQRTCDLEQSPSLKTLHAWANFESKAGDAGRAKELYRRAVQAGTAGESAGSVSHVYTSWALMEARQEGRVLYEEGEEDTYSAGPSTSGREEDEGRVTKNGRPRGKPAPESPPDLFEKAVLAQESNARAWVAWGVYEWVGGNQGRGRSIFRKGLKALGGSHAVLLATWAALEARVALVDNARALYRRAYAADPDNMMTLVKYAQLEARSSNFDRARALFAEGLERDPRNRHLLHAMAQFELKSGKRAEGTAMLAMMVKEGLDTDGFVLHTLGTAYLEDGLIEEARRCFQDGARSSRLIVARRLHVESLAELESYQGRRDLARAIYEDGLKSFTPSARYLRMYALLEKKLKNLDTAAKLLEGACRLDPMDVRSWTNLAIVQRRRGRMTDARQAMLRAIAVTPSNPDLYISLAQVELQDGHVEGARAAYLQGLRNCPLAYCGALLTCYAVFLSGERNYDEAREIFRKGAEGCPSHAPLLLAWSQLEASLHNEDEARVLQERAQAVIDFQEKKRAQQQQVGAAAISSPRGSAARDREPSQAAASTTIRVKPSLTERRAQGRGRGRARKESEKTEDRETQAVSANGTL